MLLEESGERRAASGERRDWKQRKTEDRWTKEFAPTNRSQDTQLTSFGLELRRSFTSTLARTLTKDSPQAKQKSSTSRAH